MATETTAADVAGGLGHVSACVNETGSAIGMPQLCAEWIPNQIFWLVVTLGVIFFVLSRIALPRIGAVLAERQGTITNDIAAAEDLRQRAVAADKAYNDAVAQARAEANKIVAEAKAGIQKDLDAALARADTEIAAKAAQSEARIGEIKAGAIQSVTQVAREAARDIVAAFGGAGDTQMVNKAVAARVKG